MHRFLIFLMLFVGFAVEISAQAKSQEVSESDGIPVIIKNLPQWENVADKAVLIKNQTELQKTLGARPLLDLVDFSAGTEAVFAEYEAGKLLLVEYNTPQFSIDADEKIKQKLAETGQNPQIFYRRIGNYNAIIYDGKDEESANALLDQINYGKTVQWLGEDPFLFEKTQRYKTLTMGNVLVSTIIAIFSGIALSAVLGIGVGALVFYFRKRQRANWEKFSDAGGMMRLNLDDLQETETEKLLLKE